MGRACPFSNYAFFNVILLPTDGGFTDCAETGKLITWGSADDLGHSYVASGRHEVVRAHLLSCL